MPSLQNISYNSSRIQRAYRINNIETMKLNNKIQLLEKERLHNQRLTNQDIRLISLTLDYIQTCSGHSTEGLAPEGEVEDEEERIHHSGPTFLYGERIVSRKKRRNIRPQSAMDKTSSRLDSETASTVSTTCLDMNARPQSSPIRRKPTFVTNIKDDESVFSSCSGSTRSGMSTPSERFKPAWLDEPITDVTKILLRAASENKKRDSIFNRTRNTPGGSASMKTLTRNLKMSSSMSGLPSARSTGRQSPTEAPERGAKITDILNRGPKTAMSASAWKAHLHHAQTGPKSSSNHRQYILDSKKAMNNERSELINGRIKRFIDETE